MVWRHVNGLWNMRVIYMALWWLRAFLKRSLSVLYTFGTAYIVLLFIQWRVPIAVAVIRVCTDAVFC